MFILLAGDLVVNGDHRYQWDDFFAYGADFFSTRPLMPTIGNHDCYGEGNHPALYLKNLVLPRNGPRELEPEQVYSFEYGNALFIIPDSNLQPEDQIAWLDQTLAASQAMWKFVMFHHPIYSSKPDRDNVHLRKVWMPVFDKHHVDLVFQGHDHAYLHTWPLKNDQRVSSPNEGTVYIITFAAMKKYD